MRDAPKAASTIFNFFFCFFLCFFGFLVFFLVDATQGAIPFLVGCYAPPPREKTRKTGGENPFKGWWGGPWLFMRLLRFLGSAAGRPSLRR